MKTVILINKIKRMKKLFILSLNLLLFFNTYYLFGQNQNPNNRKEQYETQKIAFLSKKINFTVQEAQQFWPYYNELQEKREELQKKKRLILQKIRKDRGNIPDKELVKLADELIDLRIKESQQGKVFHEKFKSVLPIKKVLGYYQAEEQFKTFFVRQMRNNNKQRPNGNR